MPDSEIQDPARLRALGATVLAEPDDDHDWIMADPEGNEFAAFPGSGAYEAVGLTVDSHDALSQAHWWSKVVGGEIRTYADSRDAWIQRAASLPWRMWTFKQVAEPKIGKNRWHWDVDLPPGSDPSVLVAVGAMVLSPAAGDQFWTIMADPEGNEFCAFPADH